MRVLAEKVLLLVLGLALAWLVGVRLDGFFIAGLLLAVSIAGLVEWLRPAAQWSWVLCAAFLAIAVTVPSWCAFMPLIAYDMARLPAVASPETRAAASDRFPSASQSPASRRSFADAVRTIPWLPAAVGVAATHALVHPWLRLPPNAGDGAGRTARIRPGTGPSLVGCGAARAAASAGYGSGVHSFESFAHRRHR